MSEEALSEDLADLYENAPCGYVSLSPDGRIVKVNRTLATWLGLPTETLLGQSIHAMLSFGGRIAYETHLAPLLRLQGFVEELALDLVQTGGGKLPVIANATERRGPDGRHLFTRLTLFKAVDRRTYERGLLAAREQAEQAANAEHEISLLREQFIAVLGHDLRNPLAALHAGIRMIRERERLSERGARIATEMEKSVSRATALIENVLDFARGRLGDGLSLKRDAAQPLTPILDHVVAEIRAIAPDREIVTDFAIEEPIDCDRDRIGQLVSNLAANAITHGATELPVKVEARTIGGTLALSVSNGGDAIPPDLQAKLFQPFFRGNERRSQNGLGLGLFIANEIAKAHGGRMEVTSSDDETRFTFTMPLRGSGSS
ncbi:histidine kinase [Aureimonas altamirensis]|uniref:histidine kinase n=1 Tax=Aureimonas altamirensis TaxID=370622 RepID=A0A0B1Q2Y6_9HYPH|nr:PAS domain-containing sensor histidine kinase [Aureimonas altamirensis]KHJ55213.1 histidine kinase [Aureimonas altamirensis]